jgi:hypothetical protein
MTFKDEINKYDKTKEELELESKEQKQSKFDKYLDNNVEIWVERNYSRLKKYIKNSAKHGEISKHSKSRLIKGRFKFDQYRIEPQYDKKLGEVIYYRNDYDFVEEGSNYKGIVILYCEDGYSDDFHFYLMTDIVRKRKLFGGYEPCGYYAQKVMSSFASKCAAEGISVRLRKNYVEYVIEY